MPKSLSRIVLGGSSLEKLSVCNLEEFLKKAFELGVREIDSAPTYGDLENKLGQILGNDSGWILNSKISSRNHLDFPPEGIAQQVENSLSLLKRDRLGTIFVHSVPLSRFSDDVLSSMATLKRDELTNFLGFSSNSNIENLRFAVDMPIFDRFQVTCNILDQSNLDAIHNTPENAIYFKRVFGSGVLRKTFFDDLKLFTKIGLKLTNRYDLNDYHFRYWKMFGSFSNRKILHQYFFDFVLSLGRLQHVIVGTTDYKHLHELAQLEKHGNLLSSEELANLSHKFIELESHYGWTPFR